jgi:hypothetical protein
MPAVLDTPEVMDSETYDLPEAHPQVCPDRAGFWQMVMQSMRQQRVRRFHRTPSSRLPVQKFEAPVDLLARQYPTLFIQAYAGI